MPSAEGEVNPFVIIRAGERAGGLTNSITIGADGVTGSISPFMAVTNADILASQIIFEPLIMPGLDGLPVALLADSFEITDNGRTITVTLPNDRFFADGSLLTGHDVIESFLSAGSMAVTTPFDIYIQRIQGYTNFRLGATDHISGIVYNQEANTVSFRFNTELRDNIWALSLPIMAEGRPYHGAGAFFLDYAAGGLMRLLPNPYHYSPPRLEAVYIRSANASSAATMLRLGYIDLFWTEHNKSLLEQVYDIADISIGAYMTNSLGYIGLNANSPNLAAIDTRRGIARAIDNAAISQAAFGGFAVSANGFVSEYSWLYQNVENIGFDVEGAREALYGRGLSLRLYTMNNAQDLLTSGLIAEALRDAGVEVLVHTLSFTNIRNAIESGDFDMLHMSLYMPHTADFTEFTSDNIFINPFGWHDDRAAELLNEINGADMEAAKAAFAEWHDIQTAALVRLGIYRPRRMVFFRAGLEGLSPYSYANFTWNIGNWYIVD